VRALAEARSEHPLLAGISIHASDPALDGLPDSIQTHGAAATAAALESLLVTLLGLLGRLIGDDMVATLVEPVERSASIAERTIGRRSKAQ
jgi:hypothetical protein